MVALCIAVLTGCFSNSEKAPESSNTEISSQETTEHSGYIPDTLDNKNDNDVETEQSGEELELDYNVYADAMYSLVTESLIELESIEDPDKLMEEFSDMQQNVPAMEDILSSETYYYYINGKASGFFDSRFGYILKDINDDGMDELIFGTDMSRDSITPFMIYTFDGHLVRDIFRNITDEHGIPAELDGIAENGVIFGLQHDQMSPKGYYVCSITDRSELETLEEYSYEWDKNGDPFEGRFIDVKSGDAVDYADMQGELNLRYTPYVIEEDEWIIISK